MITLLICQAQAVTAFLDPRFFEPAKNRRLCLWLIAAALLLSSATAQNKVLFIGNSFTMASGDGRAESIGGVPAIFDALARAGGHADHSLITGASGPNSFASTAEFQREIRARYAALAEALTAANPRNHPVQVAPVGSAWENAGGMHAAGADGFADLHSGDEAHGNDNGYYLAAAVFYATIYGQSPEGLSQSGEIQALNLYLTEDPERLELIASATVGTSKFQAGESMLVDFGFNGTTMDGSDDSARTWNNVTPEVGGTDDGELFGLRLASGEETAVSIRMQSRFNGANQNGTTASDAFPTDATRDSLFGNTEEFSGLNNVFPSFMLKRLNSRLAYDLTFYASRAGVGDNRETRHTVTGAHEGTAMLNVANNGNEFTRLERVVPTGDGEVTIAITPGDNNETKTTSPISACCESPPGARRPWKTPRPRGLYRQW
ncbi:MAG: hypothetical protein ACI9R3_001380 [Verrucomicrobiales bacterium]|jgi:hypothetical protein